VCQKAAGGCRTPGPGGITMAEIARSVVECGGPPALSFQRHVFAPGDCF